MSPGRARVRLPGRPVQREHQLSAWPLPQRMLGHEHLELSDEARVSAEREVRFDPLLERLQAQFLQPSDLGLRERLVAEVGERLVTEEHERVPQRL